MSNQQAQRQRTIINDEGELQDVVAMPEPSRIYCPQCGSSSAADSHFCRNCGYSLDEQAYTQQPKIKRSMQEQPRSRDGRFEMIRLLVMAMVITITATKIAFPGNFFISVFIMGMFMLMELARYGVFDKH